MVKDNAGQLRHRAEFRPGHGRILRRHGHQHGPHQRSGRSAWHGACRTRRRPGIVQKRLARRSADRTRRNLHRTGSEPPPIRNRYDGSEPGSLCACSGVRKAIQGHEPGRAGAPPVSVRHGCDEELRRRLRKHQRRSREQRPRGEGNPERGSGHTWRGGNPARAAVDPKPHRARPGSERTRRRNEKHDRHRPRNNSSRQPDPHDRRNDYQGNRMDRRDRPASNYRSIRDSRNRSNGCRNRRRRRHDRDAGTDRTRCRRHRSGERSVRRSIQTF